MKKSILITLVILTVFVGNNFAQTKAFRFGFKLSPGISWMTPDAEGYESQGAVPCFSWGFISDFAVTENYYVKTGFGMDFINGKLYYQDIRDIDVSDSIINMKDGNLDRKYKLRYLDIPLMIKMKTNQFGNMSYFGEIGFNSSFNLNAKAKDDFDYGQNLTSEPDIKDEVVFFKEALVFGAGAEFAIDESTSIIGGLTFSNGLTDILKGDNNVTDVEQKARIHYFQLTLGVLF